MSTVLVVEDDYSTRLLTVANLRRDFEVVSAENGRAALDIIYSASCADNLKGEPDTHWVQLGGGNPVSWCRKLAGRLPLLHMKDTAYIGDKPMMTEIGNGNLEWKEIVKAADESGCLWYIVEQDVCPSSPFDSLKISYEYIKSELF